MTCKEAEKSIPLFFSEKLKEEELTKFVDHMSTCAECKEELTMHFLASEGILRLEEGTTFNLENELDDLLENSIKKTEWRRTFYMTLFLIEGVALLLIVSILLYSVI